MRRSRKLVLLLIVLVAVVWRYVRQQDLPTRLNQIDDYVSALHRLGKFNGTVLVAHHGEVVFQKGYGSQNALKKTQNDVDTIYRIYSVTKPFTSTLVLKLIEEEKLSLDDRLSEFYPAVAHSEEITIEHLLTHTSGLYDFTREDGFENSEAALVDLLKAKELDFPPGQGWQYCNSGYCLLGHVIASVTNMSYEEAIAQNIFDPLDMNHSGFGFDELDSPSKAIGYRPFSGAQWEPAAEVSPRPFAAGAIYSTVGDLLRFHNALQSHQIVGETSRKKAWTGCDQQSGYGFGWEVGHRWLRRKVVGHSGGADGFRSNFSMMPSDGWCVIILSNRESDDPRFITARIYDILDNRSVSAPL